VVRCQPDCGSEGHGPRATPEPSSRPSTPRLTRGNWPIILRVIDDGWLRDVTDIGNAGPDQGQGGSFLLVHDDHQGQLPDDHYVFRTATYKNWVMERAIGIEHGRPFEPDERMRALLGEGIEIGDAIAKANA
jgi:hypothetical protein